MTIRTTNFPSDPTGGLFDLLQCLSLWATDLVDLVLLIEGRLLWPGVLTPTPSKFSSSSSVITRSPLPVLPDNFVVSNFVMLCEELTNSSGGHTLLNASVRNILLKIFLKTVL